MVKKGSGMRKMTPMKTLLALAALLPPAAAAGPAAGLEAPPLPAPAHADMEVSRDIPLDPAFSAPGADTFRVTLAFEGTATNNVQIALGRDAAPADGALSAAETAFIAGWDRGGWFIRPRGLAERLDAPGGGADGPKTLTFQIRRAVSGTLADAVFTAGGVPLAFPGLSPAPEWLDPSDWGLLRVTSRGTGAPGASVTVRRFPDGVTVIIK